MNDTYEQIVTLKPRILLLLLDQCLLREKIEIQINKQEQIFFTSFVDYLPATALNMDEKDSLVYDPYSFLKLERCLLLEPLTSREGKAQINEGDKIRIRFFAGHSAYEANIDFERIIEVRGKQVAIQVGYPTQLGILHTRNQIRVKALLDSKIRVKINSPDLNDFEPRLKEMSGTGLSFCVPRDYYKLLPVDTMVNMAIGFPDGEDITVNTSVRHYTKAFESDRCPGRESCDAQFGHTKAICGVDFKELNQYQKTRINELMFLIQREYILNEKKELIKFNRELERQVENKTNQLRKKDVQLMGMDRIAGIATLAAGIAHEINNPLSFIKGSMSFLKNSVNKMVETSKYWDNKPVPEPLLKDYKDHLNQINYDYLVNSLDKKFGSIENGVERIMSIVNNLKSFSWLGREEIEKIDINKNIEEVIKIFSSEELENVKFVKEFQEIPDMECSVSDINQCLLHIIKNATDAIENNGVIKIFTSFNEKDDKITVRIVDNGKGMSPEVLKQAFNPFFTTKAVGFGTGVGLSIIERIIKRHGGTIELSSKEKFGTTAIMTLPVESEMVKKQESMNK